MVWEISEVRRDGEEFQLQVDALTVGGDVRTRAWLRVAVGAPAADVQAAAGAAIGEAVRLLEEREAAEAAYLGLTGSL